MDAKTRDDFKNPPTLSEFLEAVEKTRSSADENETVAKMLNVSDDAIAYIEENE